MKEVTMAYRLAIAALAVSVVCVRSTDAASNADAEKPPTPIPTESDSPSTVGDPVGMIDGTVYDSAVDVSVRCPGLDLVFRRSYCSLSYRAGTLGYGWSHSYGWRVEERDGKILVHASGENDVSDVLYSFEAPDVGEARYGTSGAVLERLSSNQYAFVSKSGMRYAFDTQKRLASVTTWDGYSVVLERDPDTGHVVRARHSQGKFLGFEYDAYGKLSRLTTPDERVWVEYGYRTVGESKILVCVIRHDGDRASTNSYEYAGLPRSGCHVRPTSPYVSVGGGPSMAVNGKPVAIPQRPVVLPRAMTLVRKTNANGIETRYEYGRLTTRPVAQCEHSEMSGGLMSVDLSFSKNKTIVEQPIAGGVKRTEITYDDKRRETSRVIGDETTRKEYDESGDVVRESVQNASTGASLEMESEYDARHRVTRCGVAFGGAPTSFTRLEWDDRRNIPLGIISPSGRRWKWYEEGYGYLVCGAGFYDTRLTTRIFCSTNGRPERVVTADGACLDIAYGQDGLVSKYTMEGLPDLSYERDPLGFVSSVTVSDPGSPARTTAFVNNWRGRPTKITYPDGATELFEYDGNGTRMVGRMDALGRVDVYRWTLGLPVHAGRIVNGKTNTLFSVAHDPQLNVVAITDPLGRKAESYVLDGNARVVAVTNVEGQVMSRHYALGQLVVAETRFDGTDVAFDYDASANLSSVSYPDDVLRFSYDADGLLTSAANASGLVSNVYDVSTGWLDASTGADGSSVAYLHSNGGAVTSVTSVAGTTSCRQDAAGRWTRIESPAGTVGFGYCPWNGLVSSVTNANGVMTSYEYDIMDRVTNVVWRTAAGVRIGGFAYKYDVLGRIVSRWHDLGTNRFDHAYAYDDFDRLAADGDVTYSYDAAGNRVSRTEDGAVVTYTLGNGDRLASWTGGSYEYDTAGCVTKIVRGADTWNLTWNGQYQLVLVATNKVFAESYTYDALGRRVSTTNAEGTEYHVYDDNWQVIADTDENGNVLRSYVWDEGIDKLLAVKIGARVYTALTDIQGTMWGYADESGSVVARWTYDAWGNVLSEDVAPSASALRSVRYRFQGREWSAATGLTNFRMRWYDSVTGRWLSKDPIGLSGGLNLYGFCGLNPVLNCDSHGESWVGAVAVGVGLGYLAYKIYRHAKYVNERMNRCDVNDLRDVINGAVDVCSETMSEITSPTGVMPDEKSPLIDPVIGPAVKKIWDKGFEKIRPLK